MVILHTAKCRRSEGATLALLKKIGVEMVNLEFSLLESTSGRYQSRDDFLCILNIWSNLSFVIYRCALLHNTSRVSVLIKAQLMHQHLDSLVRKDAVAVVK